MTLPAQLPADKIPATREDIIAGFADIRKDFRAEMAEIHAELAEIRKDLRAFHRLLVVAIVGEFAGFALIIAKLYALV